MLIQNTRVFRREVVQRDFPTLAALAQENQRIWDTYYLPRTLCEPWPGHVPTSGRRMMRGLLVMAHLMVCGGFLVMTRGVPILFSRFLVLLRSLGGHGLSSRARWSAYADPLPTTTGGDTLQAQSYPLCFMHVPCRGI